ncbi:hypothetical protein E2C01_025460 [Portunus trituberculatus]|uniref:Uncharacterized protein n=1 Tax=Portunus trituberculatus TaxID=210409 RepID=A0A5B7EFK9_PORTR|nr:hypothetical protein [Portunus trituberculatus]
MELCFSKWSSILRRGDWRYVAAVDDGWAVCGSWTALDGRYMAGGCDRWAVCGRWWVGGTERRGGGGWARGRPGNPTPGASHWLRWNNGGSHLNSEW